MHTQQFKPDLFDLANSGTFQELEKALKEHTYDLNAQDTRESTALHYAARSNRKECIQLLLERGAYPNIKNDDDDTALMLATQYNRKECVQLLLEYGVTVSPD